MNNQWPHHTDDIPEQPSKDSEWMFVATSHIHGKGAFAYKTIPKGTRIIEYTGEKIIKKEGDRREEALGDDEETYLFQLDDDYDIDGSVGGSDAIYVNHSCQPNCETDIIDGRIYIIATKDIPPGDELTYDYEFDPEDDGAEGTKCNCGAPNCRGYINVLEEDS